MPYTNKKRLKDFPDRLKAYRCAWGLTMEELAKQLKTTKGAVGHWESGKREPSLVHVVKLAGLLEVTTDRLLGVKKS